MSVIDHKRIVFFNSQSSTNYIQEPTSLFCNLDPSIFQIENRELYYRFYISSLSFRNDFQDVNTRNNVLIYNGTTVYLPTGKPTIYDIIAFLGTVGIVATYNDANNYITFHTTSSYTLDFTSPNNCASLLGFISGSVVSITDGYTPTNQIDLKLETVFITSNYCNNNYTVVQEETSYTSILGSVSLLANPYQTLEFVDPVGQYSMIEKNRKDIQSISIAFVALDGTPLTLNSNFTCALTIEYLYDPHIDLLKELTMMNTTLTNLFNFQKREAMLKHLRKPPPKTIKSKK